MSLDPAVLARCRAAVLGQHHVDPFGGSGGGLPGDRPALPTLPNLDELAAVITRHKAAPAPLVRVRAESTPKRLEAPSWASCADVVRLAALSKGAGRVFSVLHAISCDVARARGYAARPDTVAVHLPASLLALGVGYSTRHLRRLLPELERAGLIACGAHASKVRDMSLWDGYLWSVKVGTGEAVPHLRREDWKHQWRSFAEDIDAGRTVKALLEQMSALHPEQRKDAVQDALKGWALTPGNLNSPLLCSADTDSGGGLDAVQDVREVAYRLSELVHVHPDRRAQLVGLFGSALARCLDDSHSRRWWCLILWQALRAEAEGRGGIGALAAALTRLEADRGEWVGLRNPAAVLAARLRVSA